MKRLRKILISCIVFLGVTTAIYATTNILPKEKFEIKKVAILGAGVFLIVQILFISYKTDIIEENNTKTEKQKNDSKIENKKIEPIRKKYEEIIEIEKIEEINENKIDNKEDNKEDNKDEEKDSAIKKEELVEDILFSLEELEKKEKEEQELFSKIDTETKIETLPDKMSPKKKNIKLKSETNLQNLNEKTNNIDKAKNRRNNVNIVRERKKRNFKKHNESNVKNKKSEIELQVTENVEGNLIKAISESKKRAKKIAKEIKNKTEKKKK